MCKRIFIVKRKLAEYVLFIGSILVIIIVVFPFLSTIHVVDYEFYTVSKITEMYDDPAFLSFHWKTKDEVITGQPIEVWAEVQLPYNTTDSLKKIEITFDGVGYYAKSTDNYFERVSASEHVDLVYQEGTERIFKSEPIKIRYAVDGHKDVTYCDYNAASPCVKIVDIIEVAPHATTVDISFEKIVFVGTIGIFILTVIVAVYTIRLERYISRLGDSSKSS